MTLLNNYIIFKNNKKSNIPQVKISRRSFWKIFSKRIWIRKASSINDLLTPYISSYFPTRIREDKTSKRSIVCLSMLIRKETVFKCGLQCSIMYRSFKKILLNYSEVIYWSYLRVPIIIVNENNKIADIWLRVLTRANNQTPMPEHNNLSRVMMQMNECNDF